MAAATTRRRAHLKIGASQQACRVRGALGRAVPRHDDASGCRAQRCLWSQATDSDVRNIDEVSVARTADDVPHVSWHVHLGSNLEGQVHTAVGAVAGPGRRGGHRADHVDHGARVTYRVRNAIRRRS